jgi:hypothetical protein
MKEWQGRSNLPIWYTGYPNSPPSLKHRSFSEKWVVGDLRYSISKLMMAWLRTCVKMAHTQFQLKKIEMLNIFSSSRFPNFYISERNHGRLSSNVITCECYALGLWHFTWVFLGTTPSYVCQSIWFCDIAIMDVWLNYI